MHDNLNFRWIFRLFHVVSSPVLSINQRNSNNETINASLPFDKLILFFGAVASWKFQAENKDWKISIIQWMELQPTDPFDRCFCLFFYIHSLSVIVLSPLFTTPSAAYTQKWMCAVVTNWRQPKMYECERARKSFVNKSKTGFRKKELSFWSPLLLLFFFKCYFTLNT